MLSDVEIQDQGQIFIVKGLLEIYKPSQLQSVSLKLRSNSSGQNEFRFENENFPDIKVFNASAWYFGFRYSVTIPENTHSISATNLLLDCSHPHNTHNNWPFIIRSKKNTWIRWVVLCCFGILFNIDMVRDFPVETRKNWKLNNHHRKSNSNP